MTTDQELAPRPEPFIYTDISQVPAEWRMMRGGAINTHLLNQVVGRAYELGYWQQHEEGAEPHFVPDYGKARDEVLGACIVENGQWVPAARA